MTAQKAHLEPFGTGYRVTVEPLGATMLFRDVVVAGELRADVTVLHGGRHLFRSTSTLALTGRDRVAKVAAELDSGDGEAWRRAVFAAAEAVIDAEESLGGGVDLRFATAARADTAMILDGLFPAATTVLVGPNEAGKSTIGRAVALSIAAGRIVIPGLRPLAAGPVLYVAGEDPVVEYHAKNLDEIARGTGLDRAKVANPIHLYDARGRSLHRLARSLAERAQDCVAVILDSYQALLGAADDGGIRDRDGLYWNAVDQLGRPTLTLGHPNRADRQSWAKADGSLAGSDVGQDRPRCRWKVVYADDDDATLVSSTRRYTLQCQKWSHGPKFGSISFANERRFKHPEGWRFAFTASEPVVIRDAPKAGRPSSVFAETADAYRAGARTPKALAKALVIDYDTARKRLARYADQLDSGEPQ